MPLISGAITEHGAVVGVPVGVSKNRAARLQSVGFPLPARIQIRAELDTGSFVTGLPPSVFAQLGIQPFAQIPVRTPSTRPDQPHICEQYDVSLTLVSGGGSLYIPSVHVIASDDFVPEEEVHGIIGRDVLNRCNFLYLGPERKFNLAF